MKAAVYTKGKSGKVLELKDLDQPLPKKNEVVMLVCGRLSWTLWIHTSPKPRERAHEQVDSDGKERVGISGFQGRNRMRIFSACAFGEKFGGLTTIAFWFAERFCGDLLPRCPTDRRAIPQCLTACLNGGRGTPGNARSGHLVAQRADLFDPDLDHIAGFEELAARRPHPGRRSREDEVAGMKRHPARQLRDLLGQVEDHVLAVGVLFEDIVDP